VRDGGVVARALTLDEAWRFVVVIPDLELKTTDARHVLPQSVPFGRGIQFELSRLLIAGLARHDMFVASSMDDALHQNYRMELVSFARPLLATLREAGALGSCWSGADRPCSDCASLTASKSSRARRASSSRRTPSRATSWSSRRTVRAWSCCRPMVRSTPRDSVVGAGFVFFAAIFIPWSAALVQPAFHVIGPAASSSWRFLLGAVMLLAIARPNVRRFTRHQWIGAFAFGTAVAFMNISFYEAIARIPLGIAVVIEFSTTARRRLG